MRGFVRLSVEENMFLKLLSAAMFSDKKYLTGFYKNVNWQVIYDESCAQAVKALVFEGVRLLDEDKRPDKELMELWEEESIYSVMQNSAKMYAHKELISTLECNGIKCCIIKGAAAAINYPNTDVRSMGDIDVLVSRENFDRAKKVLADNGYLEIVVYPQVGHEVKFSKNGVLIELHIQVSGVPGGQIGERLNKILQQLPECVDIVNMGGVDFCKPRSDFNGLILLLHTLHHLGSGIGLRQICDWVMYLNNELTEEMWENRLKPVLEENKILFAAKVLTKMCCIYMGLPIKRVLWCQDADDMICDELMRNVLDNGNFGRKQENRNNSAIMLVGSSTQKDKFGWLPFRILNNLQSSGCSAWPLARKNKIARCFAWAYVPVRFLKRIFTGERSIKELVIILTAAKKRYPLINKLKIFRD